MAYAADEKSGGVHTVQAVAEGEGRNSTADFSRFLSIANGSRREVETRTYRRERLGYINEQEFEKVLSLAIRSWPSCGRGW